MSIRTQNLAGLFKDVKTRTIIIFTGVLLAIGIIIGIIGISRSERVTTEQTITTKVPKSVSKIPLGASTTERYEQLQRQANVLAAQKARQEGKSAVPTLVGRLESQTGTQAQQGTQFPTSFRNGTMRTGAIGSGLSSTSKTPTQEEQQLQLRLQQQQEQLARQQQLIAQQVDQTTKQQQQQYGAAMKRVAQTLFQSWSSSPKQVMETGTTEAQIQAEKRRAAESGKSGLTPADVMIKAGTIVFAVLNTAINSDEPGPVMATIVSGKYKDGKLLGSFQRVEKRVVIRFNLLTLKGYPRSIDIDSYGIDGNTARTALATGVNSHYMLRYGALFASAFVQGYGEARSQPASEVKELANETVINTGKRTNQQALSAGYAKLAEAWSTALGDVYNKPPTVTVATGTGIGILFMKDVNKPRT